MRLSGHDACSASSIIGSSDALLAQHAGDDIAEEGGFGREILRALDLAADPVALELGEDFVEAGAGDIHLIERLHGGKPRGAALVGLARFLVVASGLARHHAPFRLRA